MGSFALPPREEKPRSRGLTAVIDFGPDSMGWNVEGALSGFLDLVGGYVDYAKIYALNALLLPAEPLKRIVTLYRDADVSAYAGGILFEYAWRRQAVDEMLDHLESLGLRSLEISENYITLEEDTRRRLIEKARQRGFKVIYEFGRKNPEAPFALDDLQALVLSSLDAGAEHVIVEQSELDAVRRSDPSRLDTLAAASWFEHVWIEADPYAFPQQHVELLTTFGREANLANIPTGQALRLEGFRRGVGRAVDYRLLSEEVG
ncbi:phosphosulfolactate synthase [Afifella sp. IM 167]|uniref:phosphosulfolactate synthase n=1 Tax=Afifella sp. IM 167 TaxID=2033586 RepID=UPI001CCFA6CE|nr:phosphosulfolactate synthase [Afifella sp. IM 167]MBZ8132163.1 phosphosulfolactate synthase [Afifella sp. IM 167]